MAEPSNRRFVVGYALLHKKQQSFIRPSLVGTARDRGIDLVRIDPSRPLIEQGPFDCVIHKLQGYEWRMQLLNFAAKNPGVPVVDKPLYNIECLGNRITMLQLVSKINVPPGTETFGVPKHMLIYDPNSYAYKYYRGIEAHLRYPIIIKPLSSNSSPKSRRMSRLVGTYPARLGLKLPIVVQEFVNHGGVVFKVYVAGNYVRCVKRKSHWDIPPDWDECGFPITFCHCDPKILCQNPEEVEDDDYVEVAEQDDVEDEEEAAEQDVVEDDEDLEEAELPPFSFLEKIARGLRQATGLHLFNFDMIRDANDPNNYFINYFPGYSKMPGYEEFVTDFLWDMVHQKREESAATSPFIPIF